jgi:hypothetical protein
LHFKKDIRAVSTILFVLMIFVSLIIGGLAAYLWVMSGYYNMPVNSLSLSVENVVFSQKDFTQFSVTVLNPSNSVSDLNITGFQVTDQSQNETFIVEAVEPALPFLLRIGTTQGFKCSRNWSDFAGDTVIIEPLVSANATVQSLPYVTPMVQLFVFGFSTTEDVNHFNLTVQNPLESVANLTLTDIKVFDVSTNSTPSLPTTLMPGQQQVFRCIYDWANMPGENLTITVSTDVGFERAYQTSPIQSAFLSIDNVQFDKPDTRYFNITVESLPPSVALATLSNVSLTLGDGTTLALDTVPTLNGSFVQVVPNGTQIIRCLWDWNAYRNESIVIQAFTKQGFTVQNKTVTTPPAAIWSVDNVQFDLDDLEHFLVNITNAPASLGEINLSGVDFNQNTTSMNPVVVSPANSSIVICSFNWTSFVGANVTVTAHAVYSQNETTASQTLALPYLKVSNATFSDFPTGNPYVNVTVFDSQYSPFNANITQISVLTNNATSLIDGTLAEPRIGLNGYPLAIGTEVTFVCPWGWTPYLGQNVTFTVRTVEGREFSGMFQVAPALG